MELSRDKRAELQPLLLLLTAIFAGILVIGVALGSKLISVIGVIASASALTYPVTFLISDVVAEIWGKEQAKRLIRNGFVVLIMIFVMIQLALFIPGASVWENETGFNEAFGLSLRLIVGGSIAYYVSQHHDVWAFHFWKKVTKGRHLWVRNNASTIVSQAIDTSIFVVIGFYGVAPLWPLFIGQFLLKIGLAAIDTPFIYIAVSFIRKKYQLPNATGN